LVCAFLLSGRAETLKWIPKKERKVKNGRTGFWNTKTRQATSELTGCGFFFFPLFLWSLGEVVAWGWNNQGQLCKGDLGGQTHKPIPCKVAKNKFVTISSTFNFAIAMTGKEKKKEPPRKNFFSIFTTTTS
jgi:alpha-tubulin suppressor-like RCC1 family protein